MRIKLLFATIFSLSAILIAAGCSILGDSPDNGADSGNGTIIIDQQTVPPGQPGTLQFSGVPTGTSSGDAALVVSDLAPGTYTSTEVDPAPDFDVTAVECDDAGSGSPSGGDPQSRTAVFNLDPGETVTCTFTNTRRGSLVIADQTIPEDSAGTFQFTGVPTGSITSTGTLVVANLEPGTYTSTEIDPAPDFDLTAVECDDGASANPSSGNPQTRSAIFNLDPGETVTCTFANENKLEGTPVAAGSSGGAGDQNGGQNPNESLSDQNGGLNPFEGSGGELEDFPVPDELPPGAGAFDAPRPGP